MKVTYKSVCANITPGEVAFLLEFWADGEPVSALVERVTKEVVAEARKVPKAHRPAIIKRKIIDLGEGEECRLIQKFNINDDPRFLELLEEAIEQEVDNLPDGACCPHCHKEM